LGLLNILTFSDVPRDQPGLRIAANGPAVAAVVSPNFILSLLVLDKNNNKYYVAVRVDKLLNSNPLSTGTKKLIRHPQTSDILGPIFGPFLSVFLPLGGSDLAKP
jgi:hypothetical protein